MKALRIGMAVAAGVVLLACDPQTPPTAPPQQQAQAAPPAQPAASHDAAHDEVAPAHDAAADEHQHDEMHSMLRLDDGQPWATDAPLVEGMEHIRAAVTEASGQSTLDPDAASSLAQTVRDQVDFLIANCRLEPDADATLHVFIGRLLNAAAALQADPASPEGLPKMQETLREYPHYFAHPGWPPEADAG